MNELIARLQAIKEFAKDIHYGVRGITAISLHKFADDIEENIPEYIDSIKEVCLLGNNKEPLSSKDYMRRAIILIPELPSDDKEKFVKMQDLILTTLNYIQDMELNKLADENLIGNIAENLKQFNGLINLVIE